VFCRSRWPRRVRCASCLSWLAGKPEDSLVVLQGRERKQMDGYMGKILRVNLTNREFKEEPLKPRLARDYVGGTGLGNRMIYDEVPPSTDPLLGAILGQAVRKAATIFGEDSWKYAAHVK
jgi:Aldehyde ferredoxin oxidoreductase, N-terminal domain